MRNRPDAVMIFAAGFGTRMGDLTKDQPKPLIEVAGRPLIDHALDVVFDAGLETVVANLHYRAEQLAAHLAPKGISLSLEADGILETGGGLKQAGHLLGPGPVFTINSDAVWTGANPLGELSNNWDPDQMDALLLLLTKKQAVGHTGSGDFLFGTDGRLERGPGHVYSGAQIIKTDALASIAEEAFSLNLLWDHMLSEGRLFGTMHDGGWCDVGRPEGIADAEALLQSEPNV